MENIVKHFFKDEDESRRTRRAELYLKRLNLNPVCLYCWNFRLSDNTVCEQHICQNSICNRPVKSKNDIYCNTHLLSDKYS